MALTPVLPQFETDAGAREAALADAKAENPWSNEGTLLSPLALRTADPPVPGAGWIARVARSLFDQLVNSGVSSVDAYYRTATSWLDETYEDWRSWLENLFTSQTDESLVNASPGTRALDMYMALFATISAPQVTDEFPSETQTEIDERQLEQADLAFGWVRVAGPNPVQLKRFNGDEALTEDVFTSSRYVDDGDTLATAIAEKRMYVADYPELDGMSAGAGKTAIIPPRAYYIVTSVSGVDVKVLMPVAIAIGGDIYTPSTTDRRWQLAQAVVQAADFTVHEAIVHLGETHLVMEGLMTALARNLAPNHPLRILLMPHNDGTWLINSLAVSTLLAPGGAVDTLLWTTIDDSLKLAVNALHGLNVKSIMFPNRMVANGVDDTDALPFYPYRDWAGRYWSAIRDWAANYVGLYYDSDADVSGDFELQAWAVAVRDVADFDGFGDSEGDTPVTTIDELIELVTLVIFTPAIQHTAVNFPQKTVEMATTVYPAGIWQPLNPAEPLSDKEWLDWLPPLDVANVQLSTGFLLGSVKYTTLGEYDWQYSWVGAAYFEDTAVYPELAKFNAALQAIDQAMANYPAPLGLLYDTLQSEKCTQSINI